MFMFIQHGAIQPKANPGQWDLSLSFISGESIGTGVQTNWLVT